MKIEITLSGCDDSTQFVIETNEEGKQLIEKLCTLSIQTSTYGCMPVMRMEIKTEEENNAKE